MECFVEVDPKLETNHCVMPPKHTQTCTSMLLFIRAFSNYLKSLPIFMKAYIMIGMRSDHEASRFGAGDAYITTTRTTPQSNWINSLQWRMWAMTRMQSLFLEREGHPIATSIS